MRKVRKRVRARVPVLAVAAAVAVSPAVAGNASAATTAPPASTSVPAVIGPITSTAPPGDPSHDYTFYSTPMDLAKVGYEQQEYFIKGVATRYSATNPDASKPIGEMPYETRIVVRRPVDPQRFAGVAVVDWQNVTAGHDIDTEWGSAGDFFVRHGWVWVGASVQRVGVGGATEGPTAGRGLKQWNPTRYGDLDLTNGGTVLDDSQSYDVYTQIARLVKQGPATGPDPLAGLHVRRAYAAGVSQSAGFLVRYYNGIQRAADVYDGFLVGLGGGVPRLDVPTKLFKVYTETDVWLRQGVNRVPDTPTTHTWEIAGGSHVPASATASDTTDFRAILGGIEAREFGPAAPVDCLHPGPSEVKTWAVSHAAYAALDRWVTRGIPPASAPPIEVSSLAPPRATIVRDRSGIARGGVRLPAVTVPIAVNNGENAPASLENPLSEFCVLYGSHVPFGQAKLDSLYPTHGAYVSRVAKAAHHLVRRGFLLRRDARTLIADAARSRVGK